MKGKILHLENPRTFTEKLQWLKIYDYKPEYTQMVDKLAVKDYVASRIGKEYVIPTLAVWNSVEDGFIQRLAQTSCNIQLGFNFLRIPFHVLIASTFYGSVT